MVSRRIGVAIAVLALAACTQDVGSSPGDTNSHVNPGTGLQWEGDPGLLVMSVNFGQETGTVAEGSDLSDILDRLDTLENAAGIGGIFKGMVPNPGNARYQFNGVYGLPAVDAACKSQFGTTAHFCSQQEIMNNYNNGTVTSGTGWIFTTQTMPEVRPTNFIGAASSTTMTCRGFTYMTGDLAAGLIWRIDSIAPKNDDGTFNNGAAVPILVFEQTACSANGYGFACCG